MNLALFLVATGFLTGASADLLTSAGVTMTHPLSLGMMNSGSSATAGTSVVVVRITSSMA